jgi:hypothetical protein
MSARWSVCLECNGCGARTDPTDATHAIYGATTLVAGAILVALRAQAAERGWSHFRGPGSGRPVRDLCSACTTARKANLPS